MATTNFTVTSTTTLPATITITSLGSATTANANARQGNYIDFGASRAAQWLALLTTKPLAAPTAGGNLELYMAFSSLPNSFPGGLSGVDSLYGGPSNVAGEGKVQTVMLGILSAAASAASQNKRIGPFAVPCRYGAPLIVNSWSTSLSATAGDHSLFFEDLLDQGS